jgi:hypothetical protein
MVQTVKELLNAGADPAKVDDYQQSIVDEAGRNGEIRTSLDAALENRRAQKPAQESDKRSAVMSRESWMPRNDCRAVLGRGFRIALACAPSGGAPPF